MKKKGNRNNKKRDRLLTVLIRTNVFIIACLIVLTVILLVSKDSKRSTVSANHLSENSERTGDLSDIPSTNDIPANTSDNELTNDIPTDTSDIQSTNDISAETSDSQSTNDISSDISDSQSTNDIPIDISDNQTINEDPVNTSDDQPNDDTSGIYTDQNTDGQNNQLTDDTLTDVPDRTKQGWCFARKEDHEPSGTYEPFDISRYDGFYLNKNVSDDDPVIYLAFDCGYEYGFTPVILDTLAARNVKAIFFVTGDFLDSSPELAKRMKDEGHMVGNHTDSHPSLPTLTDDKVKEQITSCEEQFKEVTGYEMDKYIRPPMGEYSEQSMKITKELGYTTIFWSIAYNDYDVENQPGKEYVIDHFKKYYHNGAITLTHSVSKSNTEALDEVITFLEEQGYRFGTLDELQE